MGLNWARVRALIFDFDGTLMDSYSAHFKTYQVALARFGLELTEDRFQAVYSPDWYRVYTALGLPREVWDEADAAWLEEAKSHQCGLLPGVSEALRVLAATHQLAIVTSGSRSRVDSDLRRTGLDGLFETVVVHEDVARRKPAPEGLQLALRRLRLESPEAVYVGDAEADFEMASRAGMDFIAVRSPFNGERLAAAPLRIEGVADLPALLQAE